MIILDSLIFSVGVTAEVLRTITGSKSATSLQRGPVDQKFQPTTDGETDRRTELSSLDRVCIPCSAIIKRGKAIFFLIMRDFNCPNTNFRYGSVDCNNYSLFNKVQDLLLLEKALFLQVWTICLPMRNSGY